MAPLESKARTFPVSGAISKYLRVKLAAGVLALAGSTDLELGNTDASSYSTDTALAVRLRTAEGTQIFVASEAITAGNTAYAAANGKVAATGTIAIGVALTSSGADGDNIEVLRGANASTSFGNVVAKTANYTVTTGDTGTTFTTVGAGGAVVFSLPAAVVGLRYRFRVGAAQELRIDPNGTETIALPSTGVQGAAGKYLTADADGETVDIECTKAGQWSVFGYTGTWTAEG
jgi:hypothetical protein